MVTFTARLLRFEEQGEKTGWTYMEIPADIADKINPGVRKSYRVKGKIDQFAISGVSVIPMGGGAFIMAVNAAMRKGIAKKEGAMVRVSLEIDTQAYELNALLVEALQASETASAAFYKMPRSHQNYYSKWIDAAKTQPTREKRVVMVVMSLERGLSYAEMLREQSASRRSG